MKKSVKKQKIVLLRMSDRMYRELVKASYELEKSIPEIIRELVDEKFFSDSKQK